MAYAVRTVQCTTCGREMTGRYKPTGPWQCFQCGMNRMVQTVASTHDGTNPALPRMIAEGRETGRQIRERKGPRYDKWLASQKRALERMQEGTGGTP